MTGGVPAATLLAAGTSAGEAATFWVLAPIAVIAAIGLVASRSAVHAALLLAVDMLALAVFYGVQGAPFLIFVQIIVYAGAVMSLFLFVLMLVGVDSSDSLVETLRGQRVAAVLLGLGFAGLLLAGIGSALADQPTTGLAEANRDGNIVGLAQLLFTRYVLAFEVTSALLITAALGAMVLTHREAVRPVADQRTRMRRRFASTHPVGLPGPGVYADRDAVDTPALLPDGSPAEVSVPRSVSGMSAERFPQPARLGLRSATESGGVVEPAVAGNEVAEGPGGRS